MVSKDKIKRINELAAKVKNGEELTADETAERDELRKEYLAGVRGQMHAHLHTITVVDEEGNDVTPEKLKKSKAMQEKNQPKN